MFIVKVPVVQDFFFANSLGDGSPLPNGKCRLIWVPSNVSKEGLGLGIGCKDNVIGLEIPAFLARLCKLSNTKTSQAHTGTMAGMIHGLKELVHILIQGEHAG